MLIFSTVYCSFPLENAVSNSHFYIAYRIWSSNMRWCWCARNNTLAVFNHTPFFYLTANLCRPVQKRYRIMVVVLSITLHSPFVFVIFLEDAVRERWSISPCLISLTERGYSSALPICGVTKIIKEHNALTLYWHLIVFNM